MWINRNKIKINMNIYVFHRCVKRNIATKVKDKHVETKHHIETHLKVSWTKTKLRTHTLNHAKMSENRRLQPRSHAHRTWATNKKRQNARIAVLPNKASKEKKNWIERVNEWVNRHKKLPKKTDKKEHTNHWRKQRMWKLQIGKSYPKNGIRTCVRVVGLIKYY